MTEDIQKVEWYCKANKARIEEAKLYCEQSIARDGLEIMICVDYENGKMRLSCELGIRFEASILNLSLGYIANILIHSLVYVSNIHTFLCYI